MLQNIIPIIFKFILFFAIFVCVGYVVFSFLLREKPESKLTSTRQRIFGLFMELDNLSIISISIICVRSIFLWYMYWNRAEVGIIHLYTLLFLSLLFGIFSRSIKNIVLDFGSNTAIYFSLLSSKLLSSYLIEVQFVWYVFWGNFLLLFFIGLCILYFFIRHVNDVVSRTKFIRRYRSEEG